MFASTQTKIVGKDFADERHLKNPINFDLVPLKGLKNFQRKKDLRVKNKLKIYSNSAVAFNQRKLLIKYLPNKQQQIK